MAAILYRSQSVNAYNIEGIKNGCLCIVEIRGTQGCARAIGECRDVAKAQP